MFNGHIDVMPADEIDEWTHPPFSPMIADGKMCGGGTVDMKGGLMASVMAVQLLKDAGAELPGDVLITSVCDEEGGGSADSTVVGDCMFEVCVHYLPGLMSYDQVVGEFTNVVERVAKSDKWLEHHLPKVTIYQAGGGFEMEESHNFVQSFKRAYETAKGKQIKVVGSPAD